ncbi:MAG TPA: cytochrome b5 domain-containing protein [Anaerolineae bacterium]|nr:cytochrome b5 domain-containing protein [Anaerolineae bacterium]
MVDSHDAVADGKLFTEKELQHYNGQRGRSIYIAYAGIVYDVTAAPKWRTGLHEDLHFAGIDLTRSLRKAPHAEEVFSRPEVKRVGRLIADRE